MQQIEQKYHNLQEGKLVDIIADSSISTHRKRLGI
jgi:hypothetical protein